MFLRIDPIESSPELSVWFTVLSFYILLNNIHKVAVYVKNGQIVIFYYWLVMLRLSPNVKINTETCTRTDTIIVKLKRNYIASALSLELLFYFSSISFFFRYVPIQIEIPGHLLTDFYH